MFRQMRRKNQELSREDTVAILRRRTAGVLAVAGDDDYPYAVPISYVFDEDANRFFFHCAASGHKMDAISRNDKVSFNVIDLDNIVPEEYTTYFRSVTAFGRARVLEDEGEKRLGLEMLAARYSPDHEEGRLAEIDRQFAQVRVIELAVEHMTGKEAIELVQKSKQ